MTLPAVLKSQYHASLAMFREAIQICPPDLWISDQYTNRFWRVAYHALFYTHFYLQPSESDFVPWEHHQQGLQRFDTDPSAADPGTPYSIDQITTYCRSLEDMVDSAVDGLDLTASESGFSWYPMSKLEHQIVNLRHLQHHTAQLADRLRQVADRGIAWVGGGSES